MCAKPPSLEYPTPGQPCVTSLLLTTSKPLFLNITSFLKLSRC